MEKRSQARLTVDYNAQVAVGAKGKPTVIARVIDISAVGAKIETTALMPCGSMTDILLYPDPKNIFRIHTTVIWAKETLVPGLFHYGLKFDRFGLFQKSRWIKHIKKCLESYSLATAVEKRMHPRLVVDKPAVYILRDGISADLKGYIANISVSGMSFLSRIEIEKGREVSFGFPFTKDVYFNVVGNIVRRQKINEGYSYGVKFDLQSDRTKPQLIELYIRERKI